MGQKVSVLKPAKAGKVFDEKPPSVVVLLERARLVLSPRGAWKRGGWEGKSVTTGVANRCAVQAVRDCNGAHLKKALELLAESGRELFPGRISIGTNPEGAIIGFNDSPETTKYEVLAIFDRAIEKAQANQNKEE